MDTNKLTQQLKTLGFKEKTIKVYLALLSLGSAPMIKVARHARIKRPIAYVCIEELINKHLASKIQKGKREYYQPMPFDTIIDDQLEKTRLARQISKTVSQIPSINKKSRTTFYEGRQQFEYIHDVMLRSKELWGLVYIEEYWQYFGEQHNRHMFELLKRQGGIVHNLIPKTKKAIEYVRKKYRKGLQEIRFLPPTFDTSNKIGFLINNERVMFSSFESLSATVIEDQNIVKFQKQLWQTLWNQSSSFDG